MRFQRIQQIEDYIMQNKTVTLDEICDRFNISKSTLRRDLDTILQSGDIKKIYGGVEFQPQKKLVSFEERNIAHLQSKQEIALMAASFVDDHDVIFVDSGTTTLHMVEGLRGKVDLTILTNNLEFIVRALPYENIRLISLPGSLDRKTLSFVGTDSAEWLQHYNISKSFMATTGFSVGHGVTNSSPSELRVKQVAVSRSQQVFLLADSSKFGAISLTTYCSLNDIDVLVTDKTPPLDLLRALDASGVKTVTTAEAQEASRALAES